MSALELANIDVYYGQVQAIHGVTISVDDGETVAVLGANGAGKTTLIKTVTGLISPSKGDVRVFGESIVGLAPHRICTRGVGYVPEGRRVFADLTVDENLAVGSTTLRGRAARTAQYEYVRGLFPVLGERRKQLAGTLSGGEQQMLAIGRALMMTPRLLLLDEPSLGLAPLIIRDIFNALRQVSTEGTTVLLVEQSAHLALRVSNRAYVLESGSIASQGTADSLASSEEVRRAYLGI